MSTVTSKRCACLLEVALSQKLYNLVDASSLAVIKPGSRCCEWATALNLEPESERFAELLVSIFARLSIDRHHLGCFLQAFVRQTCDAHFFSPKKEINALSDHREFAAVINKVI